MWADNLADILRDAGRNVVEVPGWKRRGFTAQGYGGPELVSVESLIAHWTATVPDAPGDYPTLNTILYGNGSTPGPLSQTGLGRNGTWYCIAAGLCNHAGAATHGKYTNPRSIGVEAEYHPAQGAWPDEQAVSYEIGMAAIAVEYNVPVSDIRGHYEIAYPLGRKSDPNTIPGGMDGFRERVARWQREGFDMSLTKDQNDWLYRIYMAATGEISAMNGRLEALVTGVDVVPSGKNAGESVAFWERVWNERLQGDPDAAGNPFDAEAWKWLVDRARDSDRLDRVERLVERIATALGVNEV